MLYLSHDQAAVVAGTVMIMAGRVTGLVRMRVDFDKAIWKTVSGIKRGQVMSYGQVARIAGYPRHARMVSKAMSRSSDPLPWHRVVKSDRTLAFEPGSEAYQQQKDLLQKEGVQFIGRKLVPAGTVDSKDLDEILWGPPE